MAKRGKIENLKHFSKENQPTKRGRNPGVPNRATVFKRLLAIKIDIPDPANQAKTLNVTLHEAAAMGQIEAAMNGNPSAYRVIEEALFGKLAEKTELTGADGQPLQIETRVILPPDDGNSETPDV